MEGDVLSGTRLCEKVLRCTRQAGKPIKGKSGECGRNNNGKVGGGIAKCGGYMGERLDGAGKRFRCREKLGGEWHGEMRGEWRVDAQMMLET